MLEPMVRKRGWSFVACSIYVMCVLGLLLNDQVFKTSGQFPAWFTGKFSDFCGLVVAPVTLTALFGGNSRGRRLGCFALVGALFVGTELSPGFARELAGLVSLTGLSWRLWADPTDLYALAVLPAAWWIARQGVAPNGATARQLPSRAWLVLGAAACLGSGTVQPATHRAPAYLVNRLEEPIDVDVGELAGRIDCLAEWPFEPGFLRHDDFSASMHYVLEPDQVLPIEACAPVRVTLLGKAHAVRATTKLARELPPFLSEDDLRDERQLVFIEAQESGGVGLRFGPDTESVELADFLAPIPESACAQAQLSPIEVSIPEHTSVVDGVEVRVPSRGRILEKITLGADCFSLSVELQDEREREHLELCLPDSEFPFDVGDEVEYSTSSMASTSDSRRIHWFESPFLRSAGSPTLTEDRCGLVREVCGSVWQPLAVSLNGVTLEPGKRVTLDSSQGAVVGLYLVRAFRPVLVRQDCAPGSVVLGSYNPYSFNPYLQILEVRGRP